MCKDNNCGFRDGIEDVGDLGDSVLSLLGRVGRLIETELTSAVNACRQELDSMVEVGNFYSARLKLADLKILECMRMNSQFKFDGDVLKNDVHRERLHLLLCSIYGKCNSSGGVECGWRTDIGEDSDSVKDSGSVEDSDADYDDGSDWNNESVFNEEACTEPTELAKEIPNKRRGLKQLNCGRISLDTLIKEKPELHFLKDLVRGACGSGKVLGDAWLLGLNSNGTMMDIEGDEYTSFADFMRNNSKEDEEKQRTGDGLFGKMLDHVKSDSKEDEEKQSAGDGLFGEMLDHASMDNKEKAFDHMLTTLLQRGMTPSGKSRMVDNMLYAFEMEERRRRKMADDVKPDEMVQNTGADSGRMSYNERSTRKSGKSSHKSSHSYNHSHKSKGEKGKH